MKKLILLALMLVLFGGAFAQQTLYRYYNPQIRKHYYTVNFDEYGNGGNGWQLDGAACRVFDHEDRYRGIVPFSGTSILKWAIITIPPVLKNWDKAQTVTFLNT